MKSVQAQKAVAQAAAQAAAAAEAAAQAAGIEDEEAAAQAAAQAATKIEEVDDAVKFELKYIPKNIHWSSNSCWMSATFQALLSLPLMRNRLDELNTIDIYNTLRDTDAWDILSISHESDDHTLSMANFCSLAANKHSETGSGQLKEGGWKKYCYLLGLIELYKSFKDSSVSRIPLSGQKVYNYFCLKQNAELSPELILNNLKEDLKYFYSPNSIVPSMQPNLETDLEELKEAEVFNGYIMSLPDDTYSHTGITIGPNNTNAMSYIKHIETNASKICTAIIEHQVNHWITYVRKNKTIYYKLDDIATEIPEVTVQHIQESQHKIVLAFFKSL